MIIMAQNMGLIETSARLISKKPPEKEIIHSGHFMVSNFEADADDSEDIIFTSGSGKRESSLSASGTICSNLFVNSGSQSLVPRTKSAQNISIETSLTKLFKCMSLAYRQKLTSPKWNRFKGIRLRWKDKIRLNNVIWRCWHMQFINKKNALVCQFASPLDVDTHNKPEAIVLEGKYWKRKLHAVTAEYKKWRLFSRNRLLGSKDGQDPQDMLSELEMLEWQPHSDDGHMMVDEDYMEFMTDTLFSTITANQPFAFPDTREIARGAGLADFIQPSLVQLQPNLDDFMDTLEPLQELLYSKLPPVPEEPQAPSESLYRSIAPTPAPPPSQYSFPSYSPVPSSPKPRQQVGPGYYVPSYQQLSPPPRQRTTPSSSPPHQEYVLPHTVVYRAPQQAQTMRSNSLPLGSTLNMKREEDVFAVPKLKGFGRSRSGSCLSAPSKPPPLVSANSEPQLGVTPTSSSALLAHLLTNNSGAGYSGGQVSSYSSGQALKMSGSLPSLDSYYKQPEKTQHRSVIYSTHSDNGSLNLTATASRPSVNSRLPQCQSYEPTFSFTVGDSRKLQHTSSSNLLMGSQSSSSQAVDSAGSSPKGSDSPGGTSECLSLSPLSVTSPQSPSGTVTVYKEQRRVSHINAEQKRRCNIKNGFDTLHSLIPQLSQNPNAKLSKAAMLQKGAEYIRQLRNDRQALKDEIDSLKHQVDSLNSAISNCQSLLPATGAPVSRQRTTKMREMYDEYVRVRTQENWKFWILSLLCEPLLTSFNAQVSTHSLDDLYRSTLTWVEQHCTLTVLRPLVLNALRQLCTTTEILSDPARLPAEARAAANQGSSRHGHS